ncbi:hypothetical protein CsSME_00011657 [Camellia sinensis var. sinensis]
MFVPELSVMHVEPNLSKQSTPTVVSAYTQGSHNVDILNSFFLSNIDETSWRSLSGVHANKCILRLLPNIEVSSMLSMGSYVILQDGMVPMTISASEIRFLMPIRLPCIPHEYCHSNITKSTFYRIRTEFHRGHALTKDILRPDFGWACLFEPFSYTKKYTRFVKICLAASDQD